MYCPRCSLEFDGKSDDDACPRCGEAGRLAGPPASITSTIPAPDAEDDGDRTRTENRSEPADPWAPNSIVAGKYEVLSRLGSGGFGTVYKVRHLFRKKYYALKVPHPSVARDESFRLRFEREIEVMERFVHPDVVMIRDSGRTEEDWPYFTMDFIEGESLRAVLRREGRLPVRRALEIVTRILQVLDVAHSHQIIHRDIKPDNILLTSVGGRERVKVVDFGVAKLLDLVGESETITRGQRVGTPKYMSPEQITGGDVDARSDLFSLGILLYEMVTGAYPFAGSRDPIRVTGAILSAEPEPPRDRCPDISRGTSDLILSLLEKRARRRPESALAVIRSIEALDERVSGGEPSVALALELEPGFERESARSLVLRESGASGERRYFLFFRDRVTFGRANDRTRGIANDVLLRRLPCRSRSLDPENWRANATLSHGLVAVYPDGNALVVEPLAVAKCPIVIGGVRSTSAARLYADRFHLAFGERVIELDGYRVARTPQSSAWDLEFLLEGRPGDLPVATLGGYSNPSAMLDGAYFRRANNGDRHEYYLIYRMLRVGSGARSALRLDRPGVAGEHAVILFEGGEAFLVATGGPVGVSGARGLDGEREPFELRPGRCLPLTPGLQLRFGDAILSASATVERDFKTD